MAKAMSVRTAERKERREAMRETAMCVEKEKRRAMKVTPVAGRVVSQEYVREGRVERKRGVGSRGRRGEGVRDEINMVFEGVVRQDKETYRWGVGRGRGSRTARR